MIYYNMYKTNIRPMNNTIIPLVNEQSCYICGFDTEM